MMLSDITTSWNTAVAFHGHACPGLALGCRMVLAAAKALNITQQSSDEEILCITECDACCVDAVQILLGCTYGKGNLLVKMRGKTAMTFMNRTTKKAVRVRWIAPLQSAPSNKATECETSATNQKHCTVQKQHERQAKQDFFLTAPDDLVLCVENIPFEPLEKAHIYHSLQCHACQELTAEPYLRMHQGNMFCLDCYQNPERLLK